MRPGEPAEIEGRVARIVYANPDNHWTVLRVAAGVEDIAVVGTLAGVGEGEHLRVWGRWVQDRRFGMQVQADRYEVVLPATVVGIERYLGSGRFPGIGPKTASLLVKRFGEKTLRVLDEQPERLRTVKGVGRKKVGQLVRAWKEQAGVRDVMTKLLEWGISPGLAGRIYRELGTQTVGRVRANPYELARLIPGVGFFKADRIATEVGIRGDDPRRLRAGLSHVLMESRDKGHVCLPRDELLRAGEQLLGCPLERLAAELGALEAAGHVTVEPPAPGVQSCELVYSPDLHRCERRVAARVVELLDSDAGCFPEELSELAIRRAESSLGLTLAVEQLRAVRAALAERVVVITGGPGTGKTTIIRAVADALDKLGASVALCAPTGRAAKRLASSTGREAGTIHRLLEWKAAEGGFTRGAERPLDQDAVIVDEASMVDLQLFDHLLAALRRGCRLCVVGDVDQLPSVGPGAVLRDIIDSGVVPVVQLREIFRQAQGSLIVENAHRILCGEMPREPPSSDAASDFYWIEKDEPGEVLGVIERLLTRRIPLRFGMDAVQDVQVLTPVHKGELGSGALNERLSKLLNPERGEARFAPGDKVMQVRNDYEKEVFNGDVGSVERVADDGVTLLVRFAEPEPRLVRYEATDHEQLVLAFAITIHKSQGSEYPAVVVPIHGAHYIMLKRNLVYTAVTRGKRLVVVVGPRKAMATALRSATVAPRYGLLADRLRELGR